MTMEYAVIKTGGKQYRVSKGAILEVDRLESEGKDIVLSEVLLLSSEGKIRIGKPVLADVKVKATLLENFKGDKIRVAKFKAKAKYRRVMGFRPHISRLEIKDIVSDKKVTPIAAKIDRKSVKKTKATKKLSIHLVG